MVKSQSPRGIQQRGRYKACRPEAKYLKVMFDFSPDNSDVLIVKYRRCGLHK
jgi:hypothetical protein